MVLHCFGRSAIGQKRVKYRLILLSTRSYLYHLEYIEFRTKILSVNREVNLISKFSEYPPRRMSNINRLDERASSICLCTALGGPETNASERKPRSFCANLVSGCWPEKDHARI